MLSQVLHQRRAEARVATTMDTELMRCACYEHAQRFERAGTPIRLARHPDVIVEHELPAFWKERHRRGLDAVLAVDADPMAFEARYFGPGRGRIRDVARFLRVMCGLDQARTACVAEWAGAGPWTRRAARLLLPVLRLAELPGIVVALRSRRTAARSGAATQR